MKLTSELKKEDLDGKKVLLRVDFNVAIDVMGKIDDFRIKAHQETVSYLLDCGAQVVMVSHIDKPQTSFKEIIPQICEAIGYDCKLVGLSSFLNSKFDHFNAMLYLLDNIRQDAREMENDTTFAGELASGFDFYVNDAFAVAHRNHTSVVAVTKFLPSYAGSLMEKETKYLGQVISEPVRGKVLILGGAKISTKAPVIKNFLDKAERILIGGALANNFFKAHGVNVGASLVDGSVDSTIENDKILLPTDILVSKDKSGSLPVRVLPVQNIAPDEWIVDIGPETVKQFIDIVDKAALVVWNGPMGLAEVEPFAQATKDLALAISQSKRNVIGGGDTITAVTKFGLLDKMGFVSTGGGAMLAFLAGERLPGLEALDYYKS